jgi:uncharacterized protein YbjT (DUF2867 family)
MHTGGLIMKIVIIGGSGLIGTKVASILRQRGHEVVAASPASGVNTITGEGLAGALTGAHVVVRSTQFFEFVNAIAQSAAAGTTVRLSPALLQPIGSDDVAAAVADVALGAPLNDIIEIAGPERIPLDELARRYLKARKDAREVVADVHARYFGTELNDRSLTPGDHPRLGKIRFEDWLGSTATRN